MREIRKLGQPVAWWTVEDPNWLDAFIDQPRLADFVFTTDEDCIPRYREGGEVRLAWPTVFLFLRRFWPLRL